MATTQNSKSQKVAIMYHLKIKVPPCTCVSKVRKKIFSIDSPYVNFA